MMDDASKLPVLFDDLTATNGYRIGTATLNAENTLNALSLDMIKLLKSQLILWLSDDTIAMVIIQATGDKAFCAGGDLQNLYQSMRDHHASKQCEDILANHYASDFFAQEYELDYLIHTYSKPIMCWGHGIVMGGGMGLMAGASHRVVTEKSRLAMPEVRIGLFPDVGGTWFLNRMPGKLGLFLALTGATMNAADARFVGLADYTIAQTDKLLVMAALLQQPWGHSCQQNTQLLDDLLCHAGSQLTLSDGPLRQHAELINRLCSQDNLKQIVASIKALQSDDPWLINAVRGLVSGSPGSLCLIDQMLQRAAGLSLAEVFRLEYLAALHCAAQADFAEGIRALLIDKDQQPNWQFGSISEVTPEWVAAHFIAPWQEDHHPLAQLGS